MYDNDVSELWTSYRRFYASLLHFHYFMCITKTYLHDLLKKKKFSYNVFFFLNLHTAASAGTNDLNNWIKFEQARKGSEGMRRKENKTHFTGIFYALLIKWSFLVLYFPVDTFSWEGRRRIRVSIIKLNVYCYYWGNYLIFLHKCVSNFLINTLFKMAFFSVKWY